MHEWMFLSFFFFFFIYISMIFCLIDLSFHCTSCRLQANKFVGSYLQTVQAKNVAYTINGRYREQLQNTRPIFSALENIEIKWQRTK